MTPCALCGADNATNWVSHAFSGASRLVCDACFAPIVERDKREEEKRRTQQYHDDAPDRMGTE